MGKTWVEVGLVSARGLKRSSLVKLQWYAVGWIDPKNKYCTKVDHSGNANPAWKTKFATLVDVSDSEFQDLALPVEVYSREPIFLRERLQGAATIVLREFLAKHAKKCDVSSLTVEELGSYQLRKGNSSKPHGFVDISIRISREGTAPHNYIGNGGLMLADRRNDRSLKIEDGSIKAFPERPPIVLPPKIEDGSIKAFPERPPIVLRSRENQPQARIEETHSPIIPVHHRTPSPSASRPSNHPSLPTPPPPAPPSNVGFVPTIIRRTESTPGAYMSMPPPGAEDRHGSGPGFTMGLSEGALAAGAAIFGEDFMSGFDAPRGLQDASLTLSVHPAF